MAPPINKDVPGASRRDLIALWDNYIGPEDGYKMAVVVRPEQTLILYPANT
jgi:hypothetical protein